MTHAENTADPDAGRHQYPQPDMINDRVLLTATYPAVPWACPESVVVEVDAPGCSMAALQGIVDALAGVPAAACRHSDRTYRE
jgi:hypothetical protein